MKEKEKKQMNRVSRAYGTVFKVNKILPLQNQSGTRKIHNSLSIKAKNINLPQIHSENNTEKLLVYPSEQFENIIATLHEPAILMDRRFTVKTANKAFYKKFKLPPDQVKNNFLFDLGNKAWDIPMLHDLLNEMVKKNNYLEKVEITHTFQDIGRKILLLNSYNIKQSSKNDSLILLAIADITELINKRDEINRIHKLYNDELKCKNKSLNEKTKELIRINGELESFSFVLSHDLQEPLRKIRNFSDCLLREEQKHLSGTGQIYLQRLQESSLRMQNLIEDLLKYNRIKNEKPIFKQQNLRLLCEGALNGFRKEIAVKNAQFSFRNFTLERLKIIPSQFQELMNNLISNSIKFSDPQKRLRMQLSSKLVKGENLQQYQLYPYRDYCHISFTDNGIGFHPQYSERIFEVFQRLHPTDQYEGTGMGLAICKRIVENHGGLIKAKGELKKGARFDIFLPLENQEYISPI